MEHNSEYQKRQDEFGEAYEDFEPSAVVQLVIKTGEWLETLLMDPEAVETAMRALFNSIEGCGSTEEEALGWRELWESICVGQDMELRSSQFMVDLNAFAYWGLRPDARFFGLASNEEEGPEEQVRAYVDRARALLDAIPTGWGEVPELHQTVRAAEARLRLDTGDDVSAEQLAALARISLKSVRNMLTPKAGAADLRLNEEGNVPNKDALRWLNGRADFKSSLWQSEVPDRLRATEPEDEDIGDVIFVPVARDGTWFDPVSCRNARGYTIGPKGAEEPIDDYQVALQRLSRMRTPYWRRPNSVGNWGLVAGVAWQRKPLHDLQSETEAA